MLKSLMYAQIYKEKNPDTKRLTSECVSCKTQKNQLVCLGRSKMTVL